MAIDRSSFKLYVAEVNAQGPVHEFVQLHQQGVSRTTSSRSPSPPAECLERDRRRTGRPRPNIGPQSKETADHQSSLHARGRHDRRALHAGQLRGRTSSRLGSWSAAERDHRRAGRRHLKDLVENPAHEIDVALRAGSTIHQRSDYPRNPTTDDELFGKFRTQGRKLLDDKRVESLLTFLLAIDEVGDVSGLADQFRAIG
jgi:hypothetical protein